MPGVSAKFLTAESSAVLVRSFESYQTNLIQSTYQWRDLIVEDQHSRAWNAGDERSSAIEKIRAHIASPSRSSVCTRSSEMRPRRPPSKEGRMTEL